MISPYGAKVRYDDVTAERYRFTSEKRRGRENAALVAILDELAPVRSVLDAPCGAGRVASLVADRRALNYVGVDIAEAMLTQTMNRIVSEDLDARIVRADVERLPFADESFDVTLCLRLLHHLPDAIREQVLLEAARVTRRALVVTFFHPFALHFLERKAKDFFRRRTSPRFSHTTGWIERRLAPRGFRLFRTRGTGFLRETRYAVFVRPEVR